MPAERVGPFSPAGFIKQRSISRVPLLSLLLVTISVSQLRYGRFHVWDFTSLDFPTLTSRVSTGLMSPNFPPFRPLYGTITVLHPSTPPCLQPTSPRLPSLAANSVRGPHRSLHHLPSHTYRTAPRHCVLNVFKTYHIQVSGNVGGDAGVVYTWSASSLAYFPPYFVPLCVFLAPRSASIFLPFLTILICCSIVFIYLSPLPAYLTLFLLVFSLLYLSCTRFLRCLTFSFYSYGSFPPCLL